MNAALVLVVCLVGAAREPVAVAPFANLNHDAALQWLEQGAAETMAADMKKGGLSVVERGQIAEALAQVAASARDDVARAVAAGRIAGARSIVLGSFQRAGGELRLIARIVDVETGAVSNAAKATGTLDDVFKLQDTIVAQLTSRPTAARKKAPSVRAYEKMGQALGAPTDEARATLLEQSLGADPEFSYARDALTALEQRMRDADDRAAPAFDAREKALLDVIQDTKATGDRRIAAARALLEALAGARRFHALLRASEAVATQHLPGDVVDDVNERASAARVLALARLVRVDGALAAGEKHLAAFPAGGTRASVQALMYELAGFRRDEPARRAEYDGELRELAEDVHDAEGRIDAERRRSFDFKPCIAAKWSTLPAEMIGNCRRFLDVHGADVGDDAQDKIVSARAYIAWAHALKGDFARARNEARALEHDVPGALEHSGLRDVEQKSWSAD